MSKQTSALDVTQESNPESNAGMRALDETGKVGDHKTAPHFLSWGAIGGDNAKAGFKSREWIVGNFGMRCGYARDQCGLADIWKAHQANVGEKLEFEAQMTFLT